MINERKVWCRGTSRSPPGAPPGATTRTKLQAERLNFFVARLGLWCGHSLLKRKEKTPLVVYSHHDN